MIRSFRWIAWSALGLLLVFCAAPVKAQLGNSGSIEGVVKDPSGSVIPNAKVEISNPVSGFHRQAITEGDGTFRFTNVPFNPYHLSLTVTGFDSYSRDVDVRSTVPTSLQISLKVRSADTSVTVETKREDLIENHPSFHPPASTTLTSPLPLDDHPFSLLP